MPTEPNDLTAARQRAEEALRLADDATGEPWTAYWDEDRQEWHVNGAEPLLEEDAAFIAASRTGWPDCARDVIELATRVETLEATLRQVLHCDICDGDGIVFDQNDKPGPCDCRRKGWAVLERRAVESSAAHEQEEGRDAN